MNFVKRRLDVVWFLGVGVAFAFLCVFAAVRSSDTPVRVGIFVHGLIVMFYFSILFAFALLILEHFFKLATAQRKPPASDPDLRRYFLLLGFLGIVEGGAIVLIWLHPFGYAVSIPIAVAGFVATAVLVSRRATKLRSNSEVQKKLTELSDRLSKPTDDPNELARWVP